MVLPETVNVDVVIVTPGNGGLGGGGTPPLTVSFSVVIATGGNGAGGGGGVPPVTVSFWVVMTTWPQIGELNTTVKKTPDSITRNTAHFFWYQCFFRLNKCMIAIPPFL